MTTKAEIVASAAVNARGIAYPLLEEWTHHRVPEVRIIAYAEIDRRGRPVYVLETLGQLDDAVLCGPCIAGLERPADARREIIRRADALHCVGCDYHADPACRPGAWCGVVNYERLDDHEETSR